MKYLVWLVAAVAALMVLIYVLAFSSFGNALIAPLIEKKIQKESGLQCELKTFSLSMSEFEIFLALSENNTLHLKGNYSLFSQAFDIAYRVDLRELKSLQPLTQKELQGSLKTEGSMVGDRDFFTIKGSSDIAKSATTYDVELTEFTPTSIIAKVQNAELQSLLLMSGEKQYASATLNLDVNFTNIKPHELEGTISLKSKDGKINTAVMKKDFNITLPATAFSMSLDALLIGDSAEYSYALNSNLAKLSASGRVTPEPLAVDSIYDIDVSELAVLKPLTNADIRGALRLSGKIKGDKEEMLVDGKSDIAASKTTFSVLLKDFEPRSLNADIEDMKLQNILYMFKQPHYADGVLSVNAQIADARADSLKGVVTSTLKEGLLDSQTLSKEFAFESMMPKTFFNANTKTLLSTKSADSELHFVSTLANLDVKNARFNMSDASILSDYLLRVPDLNRLFFVTQRALKGEITLSGEVKYGKELEASAYSNVAGGKLEAKLRDDAFKAKIAGMQTLELLDMLLYPKIFVSFIDGVFNYNLEQKSGTFEGSLKDGKFTQNQVLDLAKRYANTDLYKERFVGDVNAKIKEENIVTSLDLRANNSFVKTKETKLNSKTKRIHSKIDISANNNPFSVTLSGNVEHPKIAVDAKELINKEVNKFFKGLF